MKKTAKGTPILKHSAKPTEKNESVKWVLRLYVAGQTKKSLAALSNLKKICEEHLAGSYKIELIDILKHPLRSKGDQILAIPTLIRKLPLSVRKIIGDLSDTERVLIGLDLRRKQEELRESSEKKY